MKNLHIFIFFKQLKTQNQSDMFPVGETHPSFSNENSKSTGRQKCPKYKSTSKMKKLLCNLNTSFTKNVG